MLSELIIRRIAKATSRLEHRGTPLGSLGIAQTELEQLELARSGRMFHGGLQLAANGIAPDTALPTTTAKLALYNSASDGGRILCIDHLHVFVVSGTPAAGLTLWVCISNGKLATAVGAMATGFGAGPTNGQAAAASFARWGTAVTLPAGTIWSSSGGSFQLAAANFGQSDQPFEVRGSLVIPPGYAMGVAILSGAGTTPLYGVSARWAEVETDVEP
jgi:hypothetical protein